MADAWPFDPCASLDTDRDGMPDRIDCPDGVTTDLVEDDDDDNDGVLDVIQGYLKIRKLIIFILVDIWCLHNFVGLVLSRLRKEEMRELELPNADFCALMFFSWHYCIVGWMDDLALYKGNSIAR